MPFIELSRGPHRFVLNTDAVFIREAPDGRAALFLPSPKGNGAPVFVDQTYVAVRDMLIAMNIGVPEPA